MKYFISIRPSWWGGGANTFSYNFTRWAQRQGLSRTSHIEKADFAIIIAATASLEELSAARDRGVFIIHRLDEHFGSMQSPYRTEKHQRLIDLNRLASVTVFQSEFVRENVQPHLQSKHWTVILNGADSDRFHPAERAGPYIGHVSWSVGEKKRLDLLEQVIRAHPSERFLLIGNHARSGIDFKRYPNVKQVGRAWRWRMSWHYRRMKALYFPSENDPCPNTAVEAILSGVPVCYNPIGGTKEIVRDGGLPLDQFDAFLADLKPLQQRCRDRIDLHFERAAARYLALYKK